MIIRLNKNVKLNISIIAILFTISVNQCFAIIDASDKEIQQKLLNNKVKPTEQVSPQIANLELDASKVYNNDVHSTFSLQDCVENAVKYNPQIRAAVYNELAYKTKIAQAWANYFPVINLGVQIARSGTSYSKEISPMYKSQYNTFGYVPNVSANMLIFDFGKTKALADMSKRTYESKQEITKENINSIMADIKTTYYNILFAQAQVKVYEDTVADYDLQLTQAKGFYRLGKKAKIDVTYAEYNKAKATLNLIKAQNILKKAKVQLSNIMGMPEYSNYELSDEMSLYEVNCELDNAIQTAMSVRPELIAVAKTREATKMQLRAMRREFAPNLGIFGGLDYGIGNEYNITSSQFGASLSYQSLNILKTKKQIDEAKMLYKKSISDYENTKNNLYSSVKQGYLDVQTAREEIITARSSLEDAKEQCRQATGRYKAGVSDMVELKDSENTYLNARLDFYNAMLNYNTAIAVLEKEIGTPLTFSDKVILSN